MSPTSKRKSRRKVSWRWPRNFRTSRKMKAWPEILAYEEKVVLAALIEVGRPISASQLCGVFPGRFKGAKSVARVLDRLRNQRRVVTVQTYRRFSSWALTHVHEYAPNYEPHLPRPRPIPKETTVARG